MYIPTIEQKYSLRYRALAISGSPKDVRSPSVTRIAKLLWIIFLLVGTPLLGIFLSGAPVRPYLGFPPTTIYAESHSFSWFIFTILLVLTVGGLSPFAFRFFVFPTSRERPFSTVKFPWWGWGGLGLLLLSWTFAWSRFHWFQPFQHHTFTPLWIGYILVINALTVKRSGQCVLTERPHFYFALFPIGAGFWWIFEFLNRFVHNWYYSGSIELNATQYFFAATVPFSTVLPAIVGTNEYLGSFSRLRLPFKNWIKFPIPNGRGLGGTILLVAGIGLMGIGVWPTLLYPLLWLSPLLIFVGLQRIYGERSLFEEIQQGNWSPVIIPALAGLVCGVFWEMWNYYSLAQWKYIIPHVQGFQLFEMPLLGYLGYLPFGISCIALVQFLLGESALPHLSPMSRMESNAG